MSGKSYRMPKLERKAGEKLGDILEKSGYSIEIHRIPDGADLFDCIHHWYGGVDNAVLKYGVDTDPDTFQGNHYNYEPVSYEKGRGFIIPCDSEHENFEMFMLNGIQLAGKADDVKKENIKLAERLAGLFSAKKWDREMLGGLSSVMERHEVRQMLLCPGSVCNRMGAYAEWKGDDCVFVAGEAGKTHIRLALEAIGAIESGDVAKMDEIAPKLAESLRRLALDLDVTCNGELRFMEEEKEKLKERHGGSSQPVAFGFFVPQSPGKWKEVSFNDLKNHEKVIALSLDQEGCGEMAQMMGDGLFRFPGMREAFNMAAKDVRAEATGDLYGFRLMKGERTVASHGIYYGTDFDENGLYDKAREKIAELSKVKKDAAGLKM